MHQHLLQPGDLVLCKSHRDSAILLRYVFLNWKRTGRSDNFWIAHLLTQDGKTGEFELTGEEEMIPHW